MPLLDIFDRRFLEFRRIVIRTISLQQICQYWFAIMFTFIRNGAYANVLTLTAASDALARCWFQPGAFRMGDEVLCCSFLRFRCFSTSRTYSTRHQPSYPRDIFGIRTSGSLSCIVLEYLGIPAETLDTGAIERLRAERVANEYMVMFRVC